ncbi:uncharacterized protein LOC126095539 [Schistocerca cancellata]|uniref:uncharacterized protein LOC126095539 n=1 Tax=Schistocerca cancellata TaxID=274614 RepID=UPI002118F181|nr:uncharacterized protein LOC126095539 [Schistocerca cancellata]
MTMFPNYPTAIPRGAKLHPVCKDELDIDPLPLDPDVRKMKYYGMDSEVVTALRKSLNFDPQVRLPHNLPEHGVALPGGGATGALADVLSGAADAAMNPRMLVHMGTTDAVFLMPVVSRSRVCVVVPRAPLLPFYKTALRVFTVEAWATILSSYFASSLCWHVFRKIYASSERRGPRFSDSMRQVLKLFVTLPYSSLPSLQRVSSRMFAASCLIFSIIVFSAFQGSLVKILTSPEHSPDIDTLEDLDESGVSIAVTGTLLATAFNGVDSAVWKRLASKTMLAPSYYIKKGLFEDRNLAVIPEYLPVEESYDSEGRIHVVGECLATLAAAYVVPRQSPYRQQFETVIARLVEGGLLAHWNDVTGAGEDEEKGG